MKRLAAWALGLLLFASGAAAQEPSVEELLARAKKRDADAEYALGMRAYEGRGVPRNLSQARRLLERAAIRGHPEAQNILGFLLQHGVGGPVNLELAREWYEVAADRGHPPAQVNAGWMAQEGLGGRQDAVAALTWYRKAAEQGLIEAEWNAAHLLERGGFGQLPDPEAAADAYARASKRYPLASFRLAQMLEQKKIAPRGDGSAVDRYLLAAREGMADAQFAAGRLLLAAGKPAQARAALDWLDKAAAQGHGEARALLADTDTQFRIAGLLDPIEAIPWLRRAATREHARAMFALAEALARGRGTARNPAEAAQWYQKIAATGSAEAHFRLGLMYDEGVGVPENPTRARDHFSRAAEMGHAEAKARMARILDGGFAKPPDANDPFKGLR